MTFIAACPLAGALSAASPGSLVVAGNSLAHHGPAPAIGWLQSNGMAASEPAKDFVHLVAAAIGAKQVRVLGFADIERQSEVPAARLDALLAAVTADSDVIVQLGDNSVSGSIDFARSYAAIVLAASKGRSLSCVSTWWQDAVKDAMMAAACRRAGGRFVDIGDVNGSPANRDKRDGPQYQDTGVNAHPHDGSMAVIAERIVQILGASRR